MEGKNRMIKAIIADDEIRVCQLIKNLIDWDEIEIEIVGEADNGITAYDLICNKNPDIVITDIRMPGLDGLDLIKKVRETKPKTSFIIISGHKHFEYAQNAVKYGVEEYLLKPINKEELTNILIKLRDRLLENSERLEDEKKIKNQLASSTDKLRKQFLANVMVGSDVFIIEDLEKINTEYQFSFKSGCFQAIALKLDKRNNENIDEKHLNIVLDKVAEKIKSSLEEQYFELEIVIIKGRIVCLINYSTTSIEKIKKNIKQVYEDIKNYLDIYDYFHITIGIGSIEQDIYSAHKSMKTAFASINCRVVLGIDKIIDISCYDCKKLNLVDYLTSEKETKFINFLKIFDKEGVKSWIEDIFNVVIGKTKDYPVLIIYLYNKIIDMFFDTMKVIDINYENEEILKSKIYMVIDSCKYAKEISEKLIIFMIEILDLYVNFKRMQDNKPIRIAKEYISLNYKETVSLEDIANLVHLNPVYFSVIFKKEVGVNFSDYLINFRLKIAKELLKEVGYNLSEIADLVGYKDSKYFSKLFTKVVGIKPTEYRKLYS